MQGLSRRDRPRLTRRRFCNVGFRSSWCVGLPQHFTFCPSSTQPILLLHSTFFLPSMSAPLTPTSLPPAAWPDHVHFDRCKVFGCTNRSVRIGVPAHEQVGSHIDSSAEFRPERPSRMLPLIARHFPNSRIILNVLMATAELVFGKEDPPSCRHKSRSLCCEH